MHNSHDLASMGIASASGTLINRLLRQTEQAALAGCDRPVTLRQLQAAPVCTKQTAFAEAIDAAQDELSVEVATSPEQLLEAQRLRFQIYCEERGFEPGADGLEQDTFDPASRHVLVRSRQTGSVLGTVRVVLSSEAVGLSGFPMRQACEPWVLAPLPIAATGEISRFALAKDRVGISPAAAAIMRICLMRGMVQVSSENGLTHWCAIMERSLLRLLRATGMHFVAVGPTVEHHGTRQPAVCGVGSMLDRMKLEQPAVWGYVTANGALGTEDGISRHASN